MLRKFMRPAGIVLILTAVILMQIPTPKTEAASSDFKRNGNTLAQYTGTAETVSVSGTLDTIGEEAFAGNSDVREVIIEDGVKHIRPKAFEGCSGLEKVVIPDSVESIGNAAFSSCPNLKEITIGSGLKEFGTAVFAGSNQLQQVTITSPEFCFADGVLYDDKQETVYEMLPGREGSSYTMPDSVQEICAYAFWGCDHLKTIRISSHVNDISAYSFANCQNLQAMEFPYSVNRIQMKAFENCVSLEALSVPLSVQFIHSTAFDGCNRLRVLADEESYADRFFKQLEKDHVSVAEYEDIVNRVWTEAAENAGTAEAPEEDNNPDEEPGNAGDGSDSTDQTDTVWEPEPEDYWGSTTIVGRNAVVFIDHTMQTVYEGEEYVPPVVEEDHSGSGQDSEKSDMGEMIENIFPTEDGKGFSFPKYTVCGSMIAAQAYYLSPLTTYRIPDGITTISDFAFARSALTELVIPEGVTTIGYGAFYHCDYLKDIQIPSTVTEIAPYALQDTKWLNTFLNYGPEDFLIVGDGILVAYRGTAQNVRIPETVKKIGPQAFRDHKEMIAVELGSGVTEIGEEAFAGCSSLTTVKGGSGLQVIHDRAFYGCPLKVIRIPQNVTGVGLQAYTASNSPGEAMVIFQGTILPAVGYDEEAMRFSNELLRDDAVANADIAVISNAVSDTFDNTILDPRRYGFHGIVLSIRKEADSNLAGTVELRLCTLQPDAAGNIVIPDTFTIYGLEYKLDQIREDAFRYYEDTRWLTGTIREFVLPQMAGSDITKYLNEQVLLSEGVSAENEVTVSCSSNAFKNEEVISASVIGTKQAYHLSIRESDTVSDRIREAFRRLYPDVEFANLIGMDIVFQDKAAVPIQKLGQNGLTITLPVPISTNYDRIHVCGMDPDGQLESLDHEIVEVEDQKCIRFTVYHCSEYGIYEYRQTENASDSGALDESPDTGDRMNPKLILEIGLLILGLGLVLAGFWKKQNRKPAYRK